MNLLFPARAQRVLPSPPLLLPLVWVNNIGKSTSVCTGLTLYHWKTCPSACGMSTSYATWEKHSYTIKIYQLLSILLGPFLPLPPTGLEGITSYVVQRIFPVYPLIRRRGLRAMSRPVIAPGFLCMVTEERLVDCISASVGSLFFILGRRRTGLE